MIVLFAVRYALGRPTTSAAHGVYQWLGSHVDELSEHARAQIRREILDEIAIRGRVPSIEVAHDVRRQWDAALRFLSEDS